MTDVPANEILEPESFPISTVVTAMGLAVAPLVLAVGLSFWLIGNDEAEPTDTAATIEAGKAPVVETAATPQAQASGIWALVTDAVSAVDSALQRTADQTAENVAAEPQAADSREEEQLTDFAIDQASAALAQAEQVLNFAYVEEKPATVEQSTDAPEPTSQAAPPAEFAPRVPTTKRPEAVVTYLQPTDNAIVIYSGVFGSQNSDKEANAAAEPPAPAATVDASPSNAIPVTPLKQPALEQSTVEQSTVEQPTLAQPAVAWNPISVSLTAARPAGEPYNVQDFLEFDLVLNKDGYVYCYYQDAQSQVYRIFPNEFSPKAYRPAGQKLALPGADAPFTIILDHPGAEETVSCVASETDLDGQLPDDLKADLLPLPVANVDEMMQIVRNQSVDELAEARLEIRVRD